MNIEIANRLVQLRKDSGLSQEELAARIGVSRQAVSKWERAEASPDTDNLILLARLYGVSLDDLLNIGDAGLVPVGTAAPGEGTALMESGGQALPEAPVVPTHSRWETFSFPVLSVLVFLALGLIGGWWHPGWVVLLTIPVYYSIVEIAIKEKPLPSFAYPLAVSIVYLLLGFLGGWWHPGWVVFLTVPLFYSVADILEHRKSWRDFAYPVLVLIVFLLLGFLGGWWSWAWLVFLTVPLYYSLFS